MNIAFIASECTPFAKTGGLADVVGSLPHWIQSFGHDVRVFIPKYRGITPERYPIKRISSHIPVTIRHLSIKTPIWQGMLAKKVPIYFIEYNRYFDRDYLYGTPEGDYPDNDKRFIFFTRAVFEVMKHIDFRPDIIHCNDWQTGLFPAYLKNTYHHTPFLNRTRSIFTIHNIAYQGIFSKRTLERAELNMNLFTIDGLEYYNHVCFLKAGIVYSDCITTVSPTYAREIQSSSEFGYGMEGILRKRSKDLYGILNGIDDQEWNPRNDRLLASSFAPSRMNGKKKCKQDLQKIFSFKISERIPCIGIVSRLAAQKGFDLLAKILDTVLSKDIQIVILGTGDRVYLQLLLRVVNRHPKNFGIALRFDNELAHKIYAGCDFFLMPSRYEPCGLGQMISMRYGTIPIVMKTGGLADTVIDYGRDPVHGNGITFETYESHALLDAINKALHYWQNRKDRTMILKNLFKADFGWKNSAQKYNELYLKVSDS